MNQKWDSPNMLAGYLLIILTFSIFFYCVIKQIGGEAVTGGIIGHIAAWVEMFVLYLFRKKNPDEPAPPNDHA